MDDEHLSHALRYVALNPVRAGLAERAQDWPWSSAAAHMRGVDDALAPFAPTGDRVGDFAVFLGAAFDEAMSYAALRKAGNRTAYWIKAMACRLGIQKPDVPRRATQGEAKPGTNKWEINALSP